MRGNFGLQYSEIRAQRRLPTLCPREAAMAYSGLGAATLSLILIAFTVWLTTGETTDDT
jgi:hypothetical protein